MNLIAYNPWKLFDEMNSSMDRLLNHRPPRSNGEGRERTAVYWQPTVDIKEEPGRFVLYADIPGVDPKDIDITVEKDVLTIRGERNVEKPAEGDRFSRVERARGVFYRRFALPASADAERIEAHGRHGVLEMVIPKRTEDQARRIPIAA